MSGKRQLLLRKRKDMRIILVPVFVGGYTTYLIWNLIRYRVTGQL